MAYFFKLPSIDRLTIPQQAALNEPNAITISGGPGTGKSVVSLWRHIRNFGTGRKMSLLLTYTITLEAYLIESVRSEAKKALNEIEKKRILESSNNINRTYNWLYKHTKNYEEIIVDEAQDVKFSNYEKLMQFSNSISYGADTDQSLYLTTQELDELKNGLKRILNNREFLLDENFRNSSEIVRFVKALFPNRKLPNGSINGPKPVLLISNNQQQELNALLEIINELRADNVALLLPLKDDVRRYYDLLKDKLSCSVYYDGIEFNGIENVHITTFKSSKGCEFGTVIIPNFGAMLNNINNLRVINESDYYVAFTRATRNLYLISSSVPNFLERSEAQKSTYSKEIL